MVSLNCNCSAGVGKTDTLANLRRRMLIRMGYASQLAAIPAGYALLMDDYLQQAQRLLIEEYTVFQGKRFFTWDLVQGERFYDYDTNTEASGETPVCDKPINPNTVTWVGLKRDGYIRPLVAGISPTLYDDNYGESWPTHYAMRQCIELWPAPNAEPGQLVVAGNFGEGPFAVDADTTTIDSECVFLMALANAKAHAGHPDAGNYMGALASRIGRLVAGSHNTARYIPGEVEQVTPPRPLLVGGYLD